MGVSFSPVVNGIFPPAAHSGAFVRWGPSRVVGGTGPFACSDVPPSHGLAFYVNTFDLADPRPWKIPAASWVGELAELGSLPKPEAEIAWDALDSAPFAAVFAEMMGELEHGRLDKTVPAQARQGQFTSGGPAGLMRRALEAAPALYPFAFWDGERGFCGASPELLFRQQGKRVDTMALAATARPEETDTFSQDPKEVREHEIVASALVERLAPYGDVVREARGLLRLGSLVHMCSRIGLNAREMREPDFWIRLLHPTPALGSQPRSEAAMRQLMRWRARLSCPATFGAPFGFSLDGEAFLLAGIRSFCWDGNRVSLTSGCGIVNGSALAHEWDEIALKRRSVLFSFRLPADN